jgi:hypothetical protein
MSPKVDKSVLEMYARDDLKAAIENGEANPDPLVCDLENWLDRRAQFAEWTVYANAFDREKAKRSAT